MDRPKRIKTPWLLRLRRLQRSAVPALVFLSAVIGTALLWNHQASIPFLVGEVQAVRIDIAGQSDGMLITLTSNTLEPFDIIKAGDVIARLDDRPILASLAALQADRASIEQELAAIEARTIQQQADRQHEYMDQARRLAVDIQQLRLTIVDFKAQAETDAITLIRLDVEYDKIRSIHSNNAETPHQLIIAKALRDEMAQRIVGHNESITEAELHFAEATERSNNQPTPPADYLLEYLAPIKAAITAQEARIMELEIQAQSLEIRSPISGTIAAIYFHPGQAIRAGNPILTVVQPESRSIVTYVRQNQRFEPKIGMQVSINKRSLTKQMAKTHIDRVGDQYEPVPIRQLRNPSVPEWGIPVRITMPDDLQLRPGELVDLIIG